MAGNKADRHLSTSSTMVLYHLTCYLRVLTEESVLYNFFQVIDVVDLTPVLRENILHANFCFL